MPGNLRPTRRSILVMGAVSALHAGTVFAAEEPVVTVHKDPDCGCCSGWVKHLQKAAFRTKVLETKAIPPQSEILCCGSAPSFAGNP